MRRDEITDCIHRAADGRANRAGDTACEIGENVGTPLHCLPCQTAKEADEFPDKATHCRKCFAWQREKPTDDSIDHVRNDAMPNERTEKMLEEANHTLHQTGDEA